MRRGRAASHGRAARTRARRDDGGWDAQAALVSGLRAEPARPRPVGAGCGRSSCRGGPPSARRWVPARSESARACPAQSGAPIHTCGHCTSRGCSRVARSRRPARRGTHRRCIEATFARARQACVGSWANAARRGRRARCLQGDAAANPGRLRWLMRRSGPTVSAHSCACAIDAGDAASGGFPSCDRRTGRRIFGRGHELEGAL